MQLLWRRFDRLGTRLFLAMALANVGVALVAWLAAGRAFESSLADYLDQADAQRLAPLVQRLAEGWQREQSWRWIADDHEQWHTLLRSELGVGAAAGPGRRPRREVNDAADPAASATARPRARRGPDAAQGEGRLVLLDADRQPIEGSVDRASEAALLPIEVQGRVVGWLGRPPRRAIFESIERAFAARQAQQFGWIAAGGALAMMLAAALAARWLARRLAQLGTATHAITQGDYALRLPLHGHDELAELAADFNRMAAALQQAQRARQQWVADIAHELRTPLATLRAEVEALQDGIRAPTAERLASLGQEVMRLTRLVDDLRLLSLSDIGALDLRLQRLDLGAWLSQWLAAQQQHGLDGLTLQLDLPRGLEVEADPSRLEQVAHNLLQNTLRYSDRPGQLRVTLQADADDPQSVQWRWEDSAPGVPDELLARLGDRLFRVDSARDRDSGGSGLGLAISRAIIEAHGGRMKPARSDLGGLRWTLQLPLPRPATHGEGPQR